MDIVWFPSPNFNSRSEQKIDMLVLHYTGMRSGEAAIDRLCEDGSEVSAHYVVEKDGTIYQLVHEDMRAWHAGAAYWRGHTNINQRSIGIEIVNPGHEFGYRDFPIDQMEAVIDLCQDILTRHEIPAVNIVGHSDVAPTRKEDPGEKFDWEWLAAEDIGLWPAAKLKASNLEATALADFGYDIKDLPKAITAFQRHFRQKKLSGQWDSECASLLENLLSQLDA